VRFLSYYINVLIRDAEVEAGSGSGKRKREEEAGRGSGKRKRLIFAEAEVQPKICKLQLLSSLKN